MLTVTTYYLYLYTVYEVEFCELYINKKKYIPQLYKP